MKITMMKIIKNFLSFLFFISACQLAQFAYAEPVQLKTPELQLSAEQWDLVRQGEQLLNLPVLQKVVNIWLIHQKDIIELHYPGGEEGELWVEELKDWLISLGIPSKYLLAVPGSGQADIVIFKVLQSGDV